MCQEFCTPSPIPMAQPVLGFGTKIRKSSQNNKNYQCSGHQGFDKDGSNELPEECLLEAYMDKQELAK